VVLIQVMQEPVSLEEIKHFMAPYEGFFIRSEARDLAARYVWGLVLEGHRKASGSMADLVGASERSLQRLLTQVKWDAAGVYRTYVNLMVGRYADPDGVLVAGQTVFPKRGGHSVCVARQYSEELGRLESCQMATDMMFVGREFSWPFAMELYMPGFWDKRRDAACRLRREKARIPQDVHHRQPWELALDMVDRASEAFSSPQVIAAGTAFGNVAGFRDALDRIGQYYLVEIPVNTEVFRDEPELREADKKRRKRGRPRKHQSMMEAEVAPVHVSAVDKSLIEDHCSFKGAEGNHAVFCLGDVWPAHGYREGIVHAPVQLIAEHQELPGGIPSQRYYLSSLAKAAGYVDIRHILDARLEAQKFKNHMIHQLGLLQHEGRSWIGWHRHVLLVFLAWGFLLERSLSG
jgi:SRSO17 transposase